MTAVNDGSLAFFTALQSQFVNSIREYQGSENMLAALLTQAFTSYEGSAQLQSEGQPDPDCRKGCATCCSLRVVGTAPELLLVTRYLRANDKQLQTQGINVRQRLEKADTVTRGRSEQERVALRHRCPFIHKGVCMIYAARPLACRSHISYDKQACVDAAAGRLDDVPYSVAHMHLRSVVQNALQSALRDTGYPWATYELNHALSIALANKNVEQDWLLGKEVFDSAMVNDISIREMETTFDRLQGLTHK